jgi:leucyl aminopeptidase
MINTRFNLKKYFSQIAKINILNKSPEGVNNFIYFVSEKDLKRTDDSNDKFLEFLKSNHPVRTKDIIKNKYGIWYPYANSFFKERMCMVSTPDDVSKVRSITSKATRALAGNKIDECHVLFSPNIPLHHRRIALNSMILSNYNWKKEGKVADEEKSEEKVKKDNIGTINLIADNLMEKNKESIYTWINLANSTLYTRNLANERPNVADCQFLEDKARHIYSKFKDTHEVAIEVVKGKELEKKGLNLIYAVGKSAESEPRMIILSYRGDKSNDKFTHAVVGKGLTFDTGGLNLKPTNYIEDMYLDKHGACNTLSIFRSAVEMNLPINFVCAIGVAENSIDSTSYKPSDIITSYKGYTVEITNTDAEGRLVLADVISYVQEHYKVNNVIDLATLTGACMVALGSKMGGMFTNNSEMGGEIDRAADEVHEPVWQLPITDEHREDLKSPFADLKNAGKDRYGGASKGAAFLEKFVNKGVNWVHLDIAGPSHAASPYDCVSQGATGYGTQLVLKYLINNSKGTDVKEEDYNDPTIVHVISPFANTQDTAETLPTMPSIPEIPKIQTP